MKNDMMNAIEILEKQQYASSQEYYHELSWLEHMMGFEPDNKAHKEKYVSLVMTYGSRTPKSYALKEELDAMRERDIMQGMNLDNGIAHADQSTMPCTEGDTDMARHRVRYTMPDGEVLNITGETPADLVKNAIARVSKEQASCKEMPTVDEYADKWYNLVWKPKESAPNNTASNVHVDVYKHIRPQFKGRRLDAVKRSEVQAYSNELQAQGKAESTIDKIMIHLHQIFDMAIDDGLITVNPVKKIDKGNKKKDREPLTAEQVKMLVEAIGRLAPHDALLIAIPLYAGTSKQETLGLQWRDVNWDEHTLTIDRAVKTLRNPKYHTAFGPLKSKSRYRTIPLLPELEALLSPLRGNDNEQIVSGSKLMTQSAYVRAWKRITKTIELHNSTAHAYRHTFATFACEGLDPKTLQYIMGHSDISVTMDTYAHVRHDKVRGLHKTMGGMYKSAS